MIYLRLGHGAEHLPSFAIVRRVGESTAPMQQSPSTTRHRLAVKGAVAVLGKASPDALCVGRLYCLNPWGWGDTVCTRTLVLAEDWAVMGLVAGRESCGKQGRGRGDLGNES